MSEDLKVVETKFLVFKEIPNEGKKTKKFQVLTKYNGLLGTIGWYGPWRKYVFSIAGESIYDSSCLSDIIQFLNNLMEDRKNNAPNS